MKRTFFNITLTITLLLTIFSLSALAQGKFVYTNNDRKGNNSVSGFQVKNDGTLELLPGSPQGMDGGGGTPDTRVSNDKIVVTERGPFLFASSDGDQEIASFQLDPNTGGLTFIGTINLGDDGPDEVLALAVSPNEQFLYVANNNSRTVHALKINNDGTLTELEVEQLADNFRALEIAVSPNGRFLALSIFQNEADANGKMVLYTIANDGFITEATGSPANGSGNGRVGDLVFNCQSNLLYVCKEFASEGVIDVFNVAQNGSISQIQGSPFTYPSLGSAGTIDISPNGKFLFVGYGSFDPPRIGVFKILSSGEPQLIVFAPFPVGYVDGLNAGLSDITVDAKGERLFVTYKNQRVESLTIDPDGRVTAIKDAVAATGEDSGDNTSSLDSLVAYPVRKMCQIITPDDLIVDNAPAGVCGATVNYPPVTTCGSDCGTVICSPASGTFFDVGVHTVTCSAKGTDNATFKITVNDVTPPTIFQQQNIMVSTDLNKCSAVVNFTVSASDNCGTANTEVDFASGSTFPKGVTTVHIKATDKAGNESNYSFNITVSDAQAPTITCQADIMINNEANKCGAVANFALPNVSDNCPNVGTPTCNPPSGTFFPIGQTTVTCTVKDASDNPSQCTFKVTVKDIQVPTINCPGDKIAVTATPCDTGIVVNYPAPMVGDNCPNNLVVVCFPASGAIFPVGTTSVTCTVTDGGGNQAQCSFKVTVYNVWLQGEGNPTTVLLFNSLSGAYRLCYPGINQPITGIGTVIKKGCTASLEHNAPDRRLTAKVDGGTNTGTASFQSPPGNLKATIIDKNVLNNTTICQ